MKNCKEIEHVYGFGFDDVGAVQNTCAGVWF